MIQDPVIGIEESISGVFTSLIKLGAPTDDDVLLVRAAQSTLSGSSPLVPGIGQDGPQVLVGGQLFAPAAEGTFHVSVGGTLDASVFATGTTSLEFAAVTTGSGFTIQVVTPAPAEDGAGTDGTTDLTDGADQTNGTNTEDETSDGTDPLPAQALVLGGLTLGLAAFTAWAFLNWAPLAGAVAFVLALATGLAWVLTNPG